MKRHLTWIPPLFLTLALSGCWNGRVLYFIEEPVWAGIGGGPALRARIDLDSLAGGRAPRFVIVPPPTEPLSRLTTELATRRYAAAVIGPLLSVEWQGYVTRFPSTRFVLIGGIADGATRPPNVVTLTFDRRPALRSAGYASALSLRSQLGEAAGNLGARISVLAAAQSELSDDEIGAFGDGVAEGLDGERPVVKRFNGVADRTAAMSAVKQMRQDGTEIILLGMGSADPYCLEALKDAGGAAVVTDWAAWRPYPEHVFLSVEDDVAGGLHQLLATAAARDVEGPVRVVPGSAREIPREARGRLGVR